MSKRTTWTRHGPDGAEVPLERRDLGLTRHGRTTYSGRGSAPWRAWMADMQGQTGLGLLADVERATRAILRDAGLRVPRELRIGPKLSALLDATASPPQTGAYFAGRALEAAVSARGALDSLEKPLRKRRGEPYKAYLRRKRARRRATAENATYWSLRAMWNVWAANQKRHLERDTLRGRKDRRDKSAGGRRPRARSKAAEEQIAAFERLRADHGDREAGAILARKAGAQEPEEVRRRADAIRHQARRARKKVGR